MSQTTSQVEIFYLKQPATALNKELIVNLGFRPHMVWVINYKAAAAMAIAVDGLESTTTEGGLTFGANAAIAEVGDDGIFFTDNGIVLKKDASLIRANAANIVIIAFRSLRAPQVIDLSTVVAEPSTKFGKDSGPLYEYGVTTK